MENYLIHCLCTDYYIHYDPRTNKYFAGKGKIGAVLFDKVNAEKILMNLEKQWTSIEINELNV
jgi:hypothetical protein